jgi:hypothetical protein
MNKADWNSPEAQAYFQREHDHAVKVAKETLAKAFAHQPLWNRLGETEVLNSLKGQLDVTSFCLFEDLIIAAMMLDKPILEWVNGNAKVA